MYRGQKQTYKGMYRGQTITHDMECTGDRTLHMGLIVNYAVEGMFENVQGIEHYRL